MQLEKYKYSYLFVILFFIILFSIGCQSSPNHTTKEIVDLVGHWESSSAMGEKSEDGNHVVIVTIDKDGNGEFAYSEKSQSIYRFEFEMLVGLDKVAFFVNDGRQFIYKYDLSGNKLRLENVADGSLILLDRK